MCICTKTFKLYNWYNCQRITCNWHTWLSLSIVLLYNGLNKCLSAHYDKGYREEKDWVRKQLQRFFQISSILSLNKMVLKCIVLVLKSLGLVLWKAEKETYQEMMSVISLKPKISTEMTIIFISKQLYKIVFKIICIYSNHWTGCHIIEWVKIALTIYHYPFFPVHFSFKAQVYSTFLNL